MQTDIKIIVTEDGHVFRKAIIAALKDFGIVTIAEAKNGLELIHHLNTLMPDLVLLDLRMPEMNGSVAFDLLLKEYPRLKIMILSFHSDPLLVQDYALRGAKGFFSKDEVADDIDMLATMIRKIHFGGKHFVSNLENISPIKITERQKEIIQLSAAGQTKEEIGDQLGIDPGSVGKMRKKIMEKMKLNSMAKFYTYLAKTGLEFLRSPKNNQKINSKPKTE